MVIRGLGTVVFKSGDILDDDAKALVIPVNCRGILGAGLAEQFKHWAEKRHPDAIEAYQHHCKVNDPFYRLRPGWPVPYLTEDGTRAIIFFPTKDDPHDKSKVDWILVGLNALVCRNFLYGTSGVSAIAFPKLGAGLGGLNFKKQVRPLFQPFADRVLHCEVRVYE